jgi:serine/tyrosine/threonine adenylyltransferase
MNVQITMKISGYGPCAFMDAYASGTVFSSIDMGGRYAFANQPLMGQWNLVRMAETLIPLVDADADRSIDLLTEAINRFATVYSDNWLEGMRAKIGLQNAEEGDLALVNELLALMETSGADYTLLFRRLSRAVHGDDIAVQMLFDDPTSFNTWAEGWRLRLEREDVSPKIRAKSMDQVNPIYIPRNHKIEEALSAAVEREDLGPFSALLAILAKPFDEIDGNEAYTVPAPPSTIPYQTFCGT